MQIDDHTLWADAMLALDRDPGIRVPHGLSLSEIFGHGYQGLHTDYPITRSWWEGLPWNPGIAQLYADALAAVGRPAVNTSNWHLHDPIASDQPAWDKLVEAGWNLRISNRSKDQEYDWEDKLAEQQPDGSTQEVVLANRAVQSVMETYNASKLIRDDETSPISDRRTAYLMCADLIDRYDHHLITAREADRSDISRAKEAHRDVIRGERSAVWPAADAAWFKAMDSGDQAAISAASAHRQLLRDAPAHDSIGSATSVEALEEVTLETILSQP